MTLERAVESVDVEVENDVVIHAEISGTGPPVVLLHGFTGNASTMTGLRDQLSAGHLVIVPDLVGHGESSIPTRVSAYGVEAMARHVVSLNEKLGHDRFHLVGYSMGGRVALALACETPTKVMSLALVGASAGIAEPERRADRVAADRALADRIETEGLDGFVDEWMAKPLFSSQSRLGLAHIEQARHQRLSNDPTGLALSLRGGGTGAMKPLHGQLGGCGVPTVVIAGVEDPKFRAIANELVEMLADATCAVIDESGHAAHVEAAPAVGSAIAANIERAEAR